MSQRVSRLPFLFGRQDPGSRGGSGNEGGSERLESEGETPRRPKSTPRAPQSSSASRSTALTTTPSATSIVTNTNTVAVTASHDLASGAHFHSHLQSHSHSHPHITPTSQHLSHSHRQPLDLALQISARSSIDSVRSDLLHDPRPLTFAPTMAAPAGGYS